MSTLDTDICGYMIEGIKEEIHTHYYSIFIDFSSGLVPIHFRHRISCHINYFPFWIQRTTAIFLVEKEGRGWERADVVGVCRSTGLQAQRWWEGEHNIYWFMTLTLLDYKIQRHWWSVDLKHSCLQCIIGSYLSGYIRKRSSTFTFEQLTFLPQWESSTWSNSYLQNWDFIW